MKIPLPPKRSKQAIDWQPILNQMQPTDGQSLPVYPGDLKAALLHHAGMTRHPKGEATFQLAREIARLTTCCDPEVAYWFSRLVELVDDGVG
ncbi:hypothetical protein [Nodosilinea sp. FACHB-13]|uniref:hypothetical protein n=1 Tax=Cyanophyceae TaxID=3028117 RepID=UPI0018EF6F14|nr:hypothetical protein [Nodosilinea sp. FACHB-13]